MSFEKVYRGGIYVEGRNGRTYAHATVGQCLRSQLRIKIRSDMSRFREIWLPYDGYLNVKLDTGADISCIHKNWLFKLGLKEAPSDPYHPMRVANGQYLDGRLKQVWIKFANFDQPISIDVVYSASFHENLFNLSLRSVVNSYAVVMDQTETILF